jgi:hypothetical protein
MKRNRVLVLALMMLLLATMQLGAIEITVGAGNQTATVPINFQYRNTLYETIYLSGELNFNGSISGIRFYNNFYEGIPSVYVNIWLGETQQTDLASGWITPSQMTHVFSDNLTFPYGVNNIDFTFPVPYFHSGGNLVMLVEHPWQDDYFMMPNNFYAQTVGTSRSRLAYNSNFPIDPNNPPQTGLSGQFPKTTFIVDVNGMGSVSGIVTAGGSPLQGAVVRFANTAMSATTGAEGTFSFPFIAPGNYSVVASKTGYAEVSQAITVLANQMSTLDFALTELSLITITGQVTGFDNPGVGIAGAQVSLSGYAPYNGVTDNGGYFSITGVYSGQTYTYTISTGGYQPVMGTVTVGSTNYSMGEIVLYEIAFPPLNATAEEAPGGNSVMLNWDPPVEAEEGWLHYDNGENLTGFGTQGNSFTVAIRFPADALADYAGTSLYAMRVWPNTGAGWNLRVWTGGNAAQPGTLVVDQPFVPVLNSYNTVPLNNPVPITGSEELWFGYYISGENMSHAHAGVDPGPAVHGYGNMIQWLGNWTTLLAVNSYCDFNWNIQGFAGFGYPRLSPPIYSSGLIPDDLTASDNLSLRDDRPLTGYNLWRLEQGQETNPGSWTAITTTPITENTFTDADWENLQPGTYVWAVQAVYSGSVSDCIFTNPLEKIMQTGLLTGFVRSTGNVPISGAVVSSGSHSAASNASGIYSLVLPIGTHEITVSHPLYETYQLAGVVISSGQTTIQNFYLVTVSNQDEQVLPVVTALGGNYPNPFSGSTSIRYSLKNSADVTLGIFNLKGQLVRRLNDGTERKQGYHTLVWDGLDNTGRKVSNGLYYIRMKAAGEEFSRKILKLN